MAKLSISFQDLTDGEVEYLLNAYRIIKGDAQPGDAETAQPGYGEYEAAQAFVEQTAPIVNQAREFAQLGGVAVAPIAQPQAALDRATEIDREGVPYNDALHTSTKLKTKAGIWAMRKGVNRDQYDAWRAQHTGKGLTHQAAAPAPTQAPAAPMSWPQTAPVMPTLPAPAPTVTYGEWYNAFQRAYASGRLSEATMTDINQRAGVPDATHYEANEPARVASYHLLTQLAA